MRPLVQLADCRILIKQAQRLVEKFAFYSKPNVAITGQLPGGLASVYLRVLMPGRPAVSFYSQNAGIRNELKMVKVLNH